MRGGEQTSYEGIWSFAASITGIRVKTHMIADNSNPPIEPDGTVLGQGYLFLSVGNKSKVR